MRYIARVDGNAGAYGVVVLDLPSCTSAGCSTTDEATRETMPTAHGSRWRADTMLHSS